MGRGSLLSNTPGTLGTVERLAAMLPGSTVVVPVEKFTRLAEHAANLTRLTRRIETLRATASERRFGCHLRAALMAYDQTLLLACDDAGIDLTGEDQRRLRAPLHTSDRLWIEAALSMAGLRW